MTMIEGQVWCTVHYAVELRTDLMTIMQNITTPAGDQQSQGNQSIQSTLKQLVQVNPPHRVTPCDHV